MSEHGRIRSDLRQRASTVVLRNADRIAEDALAIFPQLEIGGVDREYLRRITDQLVQLIACAITDGRLDGRGGQIAHLSAALAERALSVSHVLSLELAAERAALDELAIDEAIGATTEAWGTVAQIVRRASVDLVAALVERTHGSADGMTDAVTGTRTRAFFDAVLATECDRAGRFGDRLALIVIRLDDGRTLDSRLGPGVSDRVLRRLGVLVRQYFRRQDLVARYAADTIAVLLLRADAEHAEDLAERVRRTIEQRLESADHRSGESVRVTVSAAVVHAGGALGAVIDPQRLVIDADRALHHSAARGGNRVEAVRSASAIRTPPRSSPST
jgi:diguanylate cyclase (GGDEF)-like protein